MPSNLISDSFDQLEKGGISYLKNIKPYLGLSTRAVDTLPKGLRDVLGLPDTGVTIIQVYSESSAAEAGLLSSNQSIDIGSVSLPTGGDIIIAANYTQIYSAEQLHHLVTYKSSVGDELVLTVLRDGAELSIPVTLKVMK